MAPSIQLYLFLSLLFYCFVFVLFTFNKLYENSFSHNSDDVDVYFSSTSKLDTTVACEKLKNKHYEIVEKWIYSLYER